MTEKKQRKNAAKEQFRLNCLIDLELADRLAERSAKTKLPKVGIVTLALDQYLKQADMLDKIQAELVSNPVKLAEVCKAFGLSPEK